MKRIDYTFMLTLGASIGACPVLAQQKCIKTQYCSYIIG